MSDSKTSGDDDLITETGRHVPCLHTTPSMFLDKVTILYGPTKTGKTIIVKNIMALLNGYAEQILIVSPTEPSNHSYEGSVPKPLMHYQLWAPDPNNPKKDDGIKGSMRFLEQVYARQEMMASIYDRANNLETLAALYSRLPREVRHEGLRLVEQLNRKRTRVIERVREQFQADLGELAEKIEEVNKKFKQMLVLLYKKYLLPHLSSLLKHDDLSEGETFALYYINFNPRIVLIFDDCAAELKPLWKKEIFRKIFYQGRHVFITVMICCQDDSDVPPNLRKNALVSIYTTAEVATANFGRNTNTVSKDTKKYITDIIPDVFQGNRKLVYLREDDKGKNYYHLTVPRPKPFKFGSAALWELCTAVKADGLTFDRENPYFSSFQV